MDALEIMFGKRSIADKIGQSVAETSIEKTAKPGVVTQQIKAASKVKEELEKRYIAFE